MQNPAFPSEKRAFKLLVMDSHVLRASQVAQLVKNSQSPRFDPWVGKMPWGRKWLPTPVFWSGESPWTEEPGGLQFKASQKSQTQPSN